MNAAVEWIEPVRRRQQGQMHVSDRDVVASERSISRAPRSYIHPLLPIRPVWVYEVMSKIVDLLNLEDDWDSYGAAPPKRSSADDLLGVLEAIVNPDTPIPSIVPSPDGHFQAEWHINGVDLEVEVFSPTRIEVLYSGPGVPWHDTLASDLTRLVQAVNELSA